MDDFGDLLLRALSGTGKKGDDDNISRSDSINLLKSLASSYGTSDIKDGDIVELNKFGMKRYSEPKNGKVGICLRRLEQPIINSEGNPCDMIIAVVYGKEKIGTHMAESFYFTKAEENRNVAFHRFGRKD